MNYLELVNDVLVRLREPEVAGVNTSSYAKLIGKFINDGKRAVEDATEWPHMMRTKDLTSIVASAIYSIDTLIDRATVHRVIEYNSSTENINYELRRMASEEMRAKRLLEPSLGRPIYWAYDRSDDGFTKLQIHPRPDAARDYKILAFVPQQELTEDDTEIDVPWQPVTLYAYAQAIKERGEDQGSSFAEAMDTYRRTLARLVVIQGNNSGGGRKVWQVR